MNADQIKALVMLHVSFSPDRALLKENLATTLSRTRDAVLSEKTLGAKLALAADMLRHPENYEAKKEAF